jgi:hypothetical protein
MRNSFRPWTTEDIELLHELIRKKASIQKKTVKLGRTRKAIEDATRKIMFQQLLEHAPSEVARNYDMSEEELKHNVVERKFYVPVDKSIPMSIYVIGFMLLATGLFRFTTVLQNELLQFA